MSNNLNLKECRICFENNESQDNLFISPCLCDGTSKYVHSKCLEQWINTTNNSLPKRNVWSVKQNII